jgi:hypothetical protein
MAALMPAILDRAFKESFEDLWARRAVVIRSIRSPAFLAGNPLTDLFSTCGDGGLPTDFTAD